MKKITLLIAFTFLSLLGNAQGTAWVNSKGGTLCRSHDIEVDAVGNTIQVGSYEGIQNFNPLGSTAVNRTAIGNQDMFIAKYNTSGVLIWLYAIGGTGDDIAYGVSIDSNGDILVTGGFESAYQFDPLNFTTFLTSSGGQDIFVMKLSSTGSFIWAKSAGATGEEYGLDVETIGQDVFVSGYYFSGILDIFGNTNSLCRGVNDVFLCSLNSIGNFRWAKTMGNSKNDLVGKITCFDNKVALCFSSNTYHAPTSTTYDYNFDYGGTTQAVITTQNGTAHTLVASNGAVSIFDAANGNLNKFCKFQGKYVYPKKLLVDSSFTNFALIGDYNTNMDIDPSSNFAVLPTDSNSNMFISYFKNDASNTYMGSKYFQSPVVGPDISIVLDAEIKNSATPGVSEIFIVGYFDGLIDVDPSIPGFELIPGSTSPSGFVIKYDLNASSTTNKIAYNFAYANALTQTSGGINTSNSNAIEISPVGNNDIVIGGNMVGNISFGNTIDFVPGTQSISYVIPPGVSGRNASFIQYLDNCTVNTTVTQTGNTLSVAQSGAIYQWQDCGGSNIVGATSRTYTFVPSPGAAFKVRVDLGFCRFFSPCFTTLSTNDFSKLGIKLYPNPVKNNFTIESEVVIQKLTIFNLLGQKIKEFNNTNNYDIEELNSGTYIIEVITEKGTAKSKIIKE